MACRTICYLETYLELMITNWVLFSVGTYDGQKQTRNSTDSDGSDDVFRENDLGCVSDV